MLIVLPSIARSALGTLQPEVICLRSSEESHTVSANRGKAAMMRRPRTTGRLIEFVRIIFKVRSIYKTGVFARIKMRLAGIDIIFGWPPMLVVPHRRKATTPLGL